MDRFVSRVLGTTLAGALTACVPGIRCVSPSHTPTPGLGPIASRTTVDSRHPHAVDLPGVGGAPPPAVTRPVRRTAIVSARDAGTGSAASDRGGSGTIRAAGPVQTDAYWVNLEPLATCVSCTSAGAGRDSSGAEGRELRVAGETASEGQIPANGYANGSAFTLPTTGVVELAIAGWGGSTSADRESSRGEARCSLVRLDLGDGRVATMTVAGSTSEAGYDDASSHARSRSDAARLTAQSGSFDLMLLHSESSSDAPGHTDLASVDGVEMLRSDRDGSGEITIPGVTSVALLHGDRSGGLVAAAGDGRAQRVVTVGGTWVGSPSADPQPLR
jgi:hypothetical protein